MPLYHDKFPYDPNPLPNSLEEFSREQVPLSVPLNIIRSYIVRFKVGYLAQQKYFQPYPPDLVQVTDSGKGRKL